MAALPQSERKRLDKLTRLRALSGLSSLVDLMDLLNVVESGIEPSAERRLNHGPTNERPERHP